ncbi:chorismate-binding protein [bacterium]|nr:chorismate-binding protein [bacterium]
MPGDPARAQAQPVGAAATPSREEVRAIARRGGYRRVPVRRELFADAFTTIQVLRRLRAASDHVFLLESAETDRSRGRYSFIGYNPSLEVTCLRGELRVREGVEDGEERVTTRHVAHPGAALREILAENRAPRLTGFPPFCGGLVGFFSFDYLAYAEPCLRRAEPLHDVGCRDDAPDVDLMLFDKLVVFDAYRQRLALIANVRVDAGQDEAALDRAYRQAVADLDEMERIVHDGPCATFPPLRLAEALTPARSERDYCAMVARAKRHIHEGDVFQVVLSNPITARAEGSLLDVYRVLRAENPSPYMFYFTSDRMEVAGASPETLVRLDGDKVSTHPLAGTRPRGDTPERDEALERDLRADQKELAEHNMLVDLGRNDLGRVAEIGSVRVDAYQDVLRFSHVMHLGSTVSATIAAGCDAVDVVDSILPAGTLSGAPKLRACQIIQDLEGTRRGIYGGAVGYLDLAGNLDVCIGIRLVSKRDGVVCVQSGAGIVADSVPEREYRECLQKARACLDAIDEAQGGIR